MAAPFFSIVIPCRNAAKTVSLTLESVLEQTNSDWELIVIDGASSDETLTLLEARRDVLSHLVSEPDTGIYDAMNKGIRLARGRWILFLGANDRLAHKNVLSNVHEVLKQSDAKLASGESIYDDGRIWPAHTTENVRYRNFLHHQSTFYHRTLWDQFDYDTAFVIQADYDLNLQLWKRGLRSKLIPSRVAICSSGGISDSGKWLNYKEEIKIRHRHFSLWQCWFWDLSSILRYLRKNILRRREIKRPE